MKKYTTEQRIYFAIQEHDKLTGKLSRSTDPIPFDDKTQKPEGVKDWNKLPKQERSDILNNWK